MSLSRYSLLALGIVVLGSVALGGASAQQDDRWNKIDLKPLIPPIVPLPPSAQVAPGSIDLTPTPGRPTGSFDNPQTSATGGGLRITIPTTDGRPGYR